MWFIFDGNIILVWFYLCNHITRNFHTCHGSNVVTYAKVCSEHLIKIWLGKIKFSSNLNNDRKTVKEIGIRHYFLPLTDHAEPDLSLWEKTLNKASTNEAIWYIFILLNLVKIKIKITTQGNPRSLQMRLVLPLPLTQIYVYFVMSCLVQVDTAKWIPIGVGTGFTAWR